MRHVQYLPSINYPQNLKLLFTSSLVVLFGGLIVVKMVQGRGGANQIVTIIAVTLLVLLLHSEIVDAATFQVGDAGGWTFNSLCWAKGKKFRAGDVLVKPGQPEKPQLMHDSQWCKTAKVYKSGNDQIKLAKGQNSFICSFISHCQSGMKITVNAA
ncbi:Basic blue protein [Thalictrum thalictroides]|uniref:Basic blue protein n=1 Tax=Thalictrum thalictroides TaxID=46969 RepID=A0A7J6VTJ9_THATH|nr:Basic blue protein [Thalictrum thalictroides]